MKNYFTDKTSAKLYGVKLVEPEHFQLKKGVSIDTFVGFLKAHLDLEHYNINVIEDKSNNTASYLLSDQVSIDQYIFKTFFHLKHDSLSNEVLFYATNIKPLSKLVNEISMLNALVNMNYTNTEE